MDNDTQYLFYQRPFKEIDDTLLQSGMTDFWIFFLLLMDSLKAMTFIDCVFITEEALAEESLLSRNVL